ncbi:MAG: flavodoxin family protein [Thermosulfidibacteraceae bacterium]
MRVLGIVGSFRKFGNTEILVRETLLGAKSQGAEVSILRLTDYTIKPCTGCMRCVFKGSKCHIEDGAEKIFSMMVDHDALVIGVPDYILGASGILKMLSDRSMGYMYSKGTRELAGKPAVGIVTFGVKGWEGLSRPMLSIFLLSLGYRVIDIVMANAQGPGEIVFNEDILTRCYENGVRIVRGDREYRGEPGICPVCHNNIVEIVDLKVRCPVCEIEGCMVVEDGRLKVKFNNPENNRWTEENIKKHYEVNVIPSGDRFLSLREEIKERVKKYREL